MIAANPHQTDRGPTLFMPTQSVTHRQLELLPSGRVVEGLAIWQEVDKANPTTHVTASWPWVSAWLDAFGDGVMPTVALWRENDAVVGCGLIVESDQRRMGRIPLRTVHLGTTGELEPGGAWAEYVRPWVLRNYETAAFEEQLFAAACMLQADRIDLDGIDANLFDSLGVPIDELDRRQSFVFDFSKISRSADLQSDVLAGLGKSTRKNVKRRVKQYEGLQVEWTSLADIDILDELIGLHQRRWQDQGKPGSFAEPRFENFVRSFVERAAGLDRYILARVSDARGTVGCQLFLREEDRVQDYVSGFASTDERNSPGLICHFANIVEARRRGLAAYEFLVGDARLKRDLSNSSRDVCWAKCHRPTRRTQMLNAARRAFRVVKKLRAVTKQEAAS